MVKCKYPERAHPCNTIVHSRFEQKVKNWYNYANSIEYKQCRPSLETLEATLRHYVRIQLSHVHIEMFEILIYCNKGVIRSSSERSTSVLRVFVVGYLV